jgi:hypothetical protein
MMREFCSQATIRYGPLPTGLRAKAASPSASRTFFGTMKLPRKANHSGAVGAGELKCITARVGESTSISFTLRQELAMSRPLVVLGRSKKV